MKIKLLILILAGIMVLGAACSTPGDKLIDLNNSSWSVITIQGQPVLEGTNPSLTFMDGQAAGNGSCNSFGGDYSIIGDKVTFGPLMSTMMACEPFGIMDQEQAYLAALGSSTKIQVIGEELTLFDAQDNILATFSLIH